MGLRHWRTTALCAGIGAADDSYPVSGRGEPGLRTEKSKSAAWCCVGLTQRCKSRCRGVELGVATFAASSENDDLPAATGPGHNSGPSDRSAHFRAYLISPHNKRTLYLVKRIIVIIKVLFLYPISMHLPHIVRPSA